MANSLPASFQYARLRKRLIRVVVAILLLVVAVVLWLIFSSYLDAKKSSQAQVTTFVHAIDAHVANSLDLVDLSLIGFARSIRAMPKAKRKSADVIQDLLLAQGAGVNPHFRILYIDAQGKGVATSKNFSVKDVDFSDRDYFKTHLILDYGRFVGSPIVDYVTGEHLFTVSRRVENRSGEFLGVVVALMDAASMSSVFDSARYNSSVIVTLMHRNGRIIARSPETKRTFNLDLSDSNLFEKLKLANSGVYEGPSSVDKRNHIYSYQTIAHQPLVVSVGITSDAWNNILRRNLFWGLACVVVVGALLLAGTRLVLRSYRLLARSEDNYRLLYIDIQQAEQKLTSSEHRLRTLTDNIPALITYIDPGHVLQFCNGTFLDWTGLAPKSLIGRPIKKLMGKELYALHLPWMRQALSGERAAIETQVVLKGLPHSLQTTFVPDKDEAGNVVGVYTLSTDVTVLKEKEKQLGLWARFDDLTGLPNRRELNDRLKEAIGRSRRTGLPLSVLFLDIDYFKGINDRYGHAAGDAVLQEFSQRLQGCLRSTDTVARLGGDEFVIVLEDARTVKEVRCVATKILAAMQAVVETAAGVLQISTSIGIYHGRTVAKSVEELLSLADEALYEAKASGRGNYALREC